MNDLLKALVKESSSLINRIHTIELYLEKKSEVISKTPYTEKDLQEHKIRLQEVKVAIEAIKEFRKKQNQ